MAKDVPHLEEILSRLKHGQSCEIGGVWGSAYVYLTGLIHEELKPNITLVVTPGIEEAEAAVEGDPVEILKGERFPNSLQPVIDHIKPRNVAVFHGVIVMEKLNSFERFIFKKVSDIEGDFRDWDAITSWAQSIADALKK